ncbi:MAG TPA: Ku protein [Actinomycetota bacterium]|nr:Ku protein [Actinomycetota bacterium]
MARAIWKGAISFGLVTIPIRVHTAVEEKSFKFNQLHEKDQGRIKYKRTCSVDGEEVPFDEIVRGYEYEKDHYVVLTDDDIDRGLSNVRTIDIQKFVDASEIDPIYWQRSYYLAPDGTPGLKAYKLLSKALKDDNRVAVAKVAFRDKEHLATLRVRDGVFVLETMYWPDEIRDAEFEELDEDVKIGSAELQMAKSLIDNMTGDFDPEEFKDEYREKLESLVAKKVEGEEIAVVEETGTAKVLDLIEALKASVAQSEKPAKKKAAKAAPKKKKAAAG